MVTQTINLNLIPGGVSPVIHVNQYDIGNAALILTLHNGFSEFTVPASASVTLVGTKPDNTGFVYAAESVSGSLATVNVTQQMTALAGDVMCELRIRNEAAGANSDETGHSDHENIGTINFILRVERAALSDDTVISKTDIPLIEQAIDVSKNFMGYVQETRDNAATSTTMAKTAVNAMEAAAESEKNAKTYNGNVVQLAEGISKATGAANTAAENANNVAKAIQSKLDNGEFVGPQGPKGDTGESGIVTQASGMVTFAYDPNDGHLYAYSSADVSGSYQFDETDGHLYYVTEG